MSETYRTRKTRAVRIYCPIEAATLKSMLAGDASAMDRDPTLAKILAIIRNDNPLGDFGIYKSVVEIAPGWELFTPAADARPTVGTANANTISPTAILTTFVAADASPDAIGNALAKLIEAHPWEVPVIEIIETVLLTRP